MMTLWLLLLLVFGFWIHASLSFLSLLPLDVSMIGSRSSISGRLHQELELSSTTTRVVGSSLGPPEPLHSLQVGETLRAFRRQPNNGENHDFTVSRVAQDPHVFVLRNFLSLRDCQRIMNHAQQRTITMERAETITQGDTDSRKHCRVAWIRELQQRSNDDDDDDDSDAPLLWIGSMTRAIAQMFLSPAVRSNPRSGVEDMQVLEYQKDGEFVLHHDGEPRVLTVIYYLNGVAGTWFPLARVDANNNNNNSNNNGLLLPPINNKKEALKRCEGLRAGRDGLVVLGGHNHVPEAPSSPGCPVLHVNPGDALAFYNYRDDEDSGRINWNAIHAGLPVVGNDVKWIANHWFRCGR